MVSCSHRFLSAVFVGAVLLCILSAGFAAADEDPDMPEGVSVLCDLGSLRGWNINRLADCDSLELYELPKGSGNFVGRFLITPTDKLISNGRRAEIRDPHVAVNLDRVWYRFSTIIPRDFPISMPHSVVTAQWHEKQFAGHPAQRPPVAHRLVNGEFRVELWNDDIFSRENEDKNGLIVYREPDYALGKVHEFIYRIDWRPDASGAVTGWKRECDILPCEDVEWTRFVNYQGAIGYREVRGYYFKMGIYTVHEFSKPMSVFHTDYGRGGTAESIGLDSSWSNR